MSDYIRSVPDVSSSSEFSRPMMRLGTPLILPPGYGCVLMTGLASVVLIWWKSWNLAIARRDLKVPNPLTYSDTSMAFNYVYRALQSTVEIYPQFLFLLLIGGLEMPYFCSLGGVIWILGRYVAAREFYRGDMARRRNGSFHVAGLSMLIIGALRFGLKRMFL